MRGKIGLFLVGVLLSFSLSASKWEQMKPGFENLIRETQLQFPVPGFAIAIVENGQIRYIKGFGVKEFGKEENVNTKTLFQIGSVTKGMTATLIARLVYEQHLDLNDKVIDLVPDFKYCDEEHSNNLTIKDILAQRSGLPGYAGDPDIQAGKHFRDVLPSLEKVAPIAPLRQKFSYQNVIYCLAGQIAEKKMHKSMEDLFKDKFFLPLGMERASLGLGPLMLQDNKAFSHHVGSLLPPKVLKFSEFGYRIPYAGGINMDIEDVAKYMQLHINKGKLGNLTYLPEYLMAEMHKVQIDTTGQEQRRYYKHYYPKERVKKTGYGLGWRIHDWNGIQVVSHAGFVKGQLAFIAFLPEQKAGIAILANAATPLTTILRSSFLDRYLDFTGIDWLARAVSMKGKDKAKTKKATQKQVPKKNTQTKKQTFIQKKPLLKQGKTVPEQKKQKQRKAIDTKNSARNKNQL